ncbi:MAG: PHP domain-containing protein [Clostridiales Family XIII bacterium]|jgi:putative hydrolase|nr:PHP domain-containing protein [Clostridiales Family XIII bacterium]
MMPAGTAADAAHKAAYSVGGKTYGIAFDVHTHTRYSHGKGSIEDNVKAALALGLERIGISDHGPAHIGFGVSRRKLAAMRCEVDALKKAYPDIEIQLGVEANIMGGGSALDIHPDDLGLLDYVLAGYHYGAVGKKPLASMWRSFENFVTPQGSGTRGLAAKNTRDVVRALRSNNVYALTHPGDKSPVDLKEIAAVCTETGTLVELNTSHRSLAPADIMDMAAYGVSFIIGSDAHVPHRVGDFRSAVDLIIEAGLEPSRVVNLKIIEQDE